MTSSAAMGAGAETTQRGVVLLCAGRGTRMRPLTDVVPKCMLPAGDRLVIDHLLDAILARTAGEVVVVTGFAAGRVNGHLEAHYGARVSTAHNDRFDEDVNIRKDGDRQYLVRGQTPIDEFNEYFQTELSDDEFDTVAGLVMKQLGRLPRRGETLQLADCEIKVMRFDRRRIDVLRLTSPRDIVPPEDRPLSPE